MGIFSRFFNRNKDNSKGQENNQRQKCKVISIFSSTSDFIYQTQDLCVNCNFALEKKLSYCNQCGVSV